MIQIYDPSFRDKKQSDVLKSINFNEEWRPYGYKCMLFNRSEGVVYVFRDKSDYFAKLAAL